MRIESKISIILMSFFAAFVIVTLAVVLTSEYKYNDIEINGVDHFEDTLRSDINLERSFFLFTPKFTIKNKLANLGYIADYSVQRKFPNNLTVTAELDDVVWCSDEFLIYDDYLLEISELLLDECNEIPRVVDVIDGQVDLLEIVESFSTIDISIRKLVTEITFIDNETLSLNMSDGVTVYLTINEDKTISDYLVNYFEYKIEDNIIDLRLKYQ